MVRNATGASYPAVSDRIVFESKIPLPPISEQQRIAAILDAADALRTKRRAALAKLNSLAQSIFIEMFGDPIANPKGYRVVRLGDVIDFLTSGSRGWAKYYSDTGSLFLRIQNVRTDQLDLSDVAYVQPPNTAEALRTKVQTGDVLLSITADLGRTAVVPSGLGGAFINQHLSILRTQYFEPRFLSAALASPAGQRMVQSRNREGVKAGLNFDDIRSFELPDVSRAEQKLFTKRVSQVDFLKGCLTVGLDRMQALFASLQERAFQGEL
jgi:type I restriction enzyme, S subunit